MLSPAGSHCYSFLNKSLSEQSIGENEVNIGLLEPGDKHLAVKHLKCTAQAVQRNL